MVSPVPLEFAPSRSTSSVWAILAAFPRTLSEPVDLFPILLRAIIDENRAAASYGRSRLLEIDAYESATKFAPVAPLLTLSRTGIVAPRTDEGGGAYKRWDGKANYFAAAGDHMIAMWGILQS